MLRPIIKIIEVPCSQEKAFTLFVDELGCWWPLNKRSVSLKNRGPAKPLRVEPRVGGKIVEIDHDDTEYLWGTIESFDPHDSIEMALHMSQPAEAASVVEVKFTVLGNERTRVELTHGEWEAFGDLAGMMRDGYRSGWDISFENAYRSACSGEQDLSIY